MNMYLLMEQDVVHPENRDVVLSGGCVYSLYDIVTKQCVNGFDNLKATVLFAESYEEAYRMVESLGG